MKFFYVYILQCKDESYYIGMTSNLEDRIFQHNSGKFQDAYTYSRRPVILKWMQQFTDANHAMDREKQIKGWSRKKKKDLINEDWARLVEYSKNKYRKL